jgi:hypothetical protein
MSDVALHTLCDNALKLYHAIIAMPFGGDRPCNQDSRTMQFVAVAGTRPSARLMNSRDQRLSNAVRQRLEREVPLGAFLSLGAGQGQHGSGAVAP